MLNHLKLKHIEVFSLMDIFPMKEIYPRYKLCSKVFGEARGAAARRVSMRRKTLPCIQAQISRLSDVQV